MSSTELTLPSGAKLKITLAPFEDAKSLYQAMLEEMKGTKLDPKEQVDANFFKDLFCIALSSKKVEQAVWKCFERVTYNDIKVSKDTFEPESARQDYFDVMYEVGRANILPFTKSLYAKYSQVLDLLKGSQK